MTRLKFDKKDVKFMLKYDKLNDPLSSFFSHIILELGLEVEFLSKGSIDVSKVKINRDQYETLFKPYLVKYAKKELPFVADHKIDLSVRLYDLCYGPSVSDYVEPNVIVIENGFIREGVMND